MTFTIFKKTGEYIDSNGDWDGDEGYDIELEVAEEKVHRDIAEMLYNDYILCAMPLKTEYKINYIAVREQIEKMLNDMDCWDLAIKFYYEDLQDKYQERYGNG